VLCLFKPQAVPLDPGQLDQGEEQTGILALLNISLEDAQYHHDCVLEVAYKVI